MGKAHKRPRAGQGRPAGGTKPKGGRQAHSNGAGPQQQEGAGPGSGSDSEPIDILDEDIDFVKVRNGAVCTACERELTACAAGEPVLRQHAGADGH